MGSQLKSRSKTGLSDGFSICIEELKKKRSLPEADSRRKGDSLVVLCFRANDDSACIFEECPSYRYCFITDNENSVVGLKI